MTDRHEIARIIAQGLPCDYLAVHGEDGQHFEAVVVSPAFTGKTRIQQHQMVYQVLGERMRGEIHALSMRTYTPEAWRGSGNAMDKER